MGARVPGKETPKPEFSSKPKVIRRNADNGRKVDRRHFRLALEFGGAILRQLHNARLDFASRLCGRSLR